jgi:4-hydroxy-tetrahydrodipicolinate reductase
LKRPIKVVQVGVGPLGKIIVKHIAGERKGLKIVGAVDLNPGVAGKDLGEVCGIRKLGIAISGNAEKVFASTRPDIAIYTTTSFARDTYKQVEPAIKHGVNVISTCEQLSYPYFAESSLTDKYDKLAIRNGVSILGTGINPGFLMDLRAIVLSTGCTSVGKIEITRVMNASNRRESFQKKIGASMTPAGFKQAMKEGKITGHVGLEESICLIAESLGWELDELRVDDAEPVIAEKAVASPFYQVKKGQVKGVKQAAYGVKGKKNLVTLNFAAYLDAEPSYDEVHISGTPEITARVSPCWQGDYGTVAMVVNLIPAVLNARPGILTITDLVPLGFKSGDMSRYLTGPDCGCC